MKFSNEKISDEIFAVRMKFVPPDLRTREPCFTGKKIRARSSKEESPGTWLKVEILAVRSSMVVICTGSSIFQVNASKSRRPLDTVDLEEVPDSREQTGAHLCCGFLANVKLMFGKLFSGNSHLSAILDRRGLSVTVPVDLGTKNSESFSPQLLQGFWSKLKNNLKIVVMFPTVTTKNPKQKAVHMATIPSELGRSRTSNLWW